MERQLKNLAQAGINLVKWSSEDTKMGLDFKICQWHGIFFAQTVRIKLASPQAAQLSILYGGIRSVAPPRGT